MHPSAQSVIIGGFFYVLYVHGKTQLYMYVLNSYTYIGSLPWSYERQHYGKLRAFATKQKIIINSTLRCLFCDVRT
jgi:hypothetical protein